MATRVIEEAHASFPGASIALPGCDAQEQFRRAYACDVINDPELFEETLSIDAMLRSFKRGDGTLRLVYRRRLGDLGPRWVETSVTVIERPYSGEIVAFLYCRNIDGEKKDRLAVESIMDEEIESVIVLRVNEGIAHLVQGKDNFGSLVPNEDFDFDERFDRKIKAEVASEDQAAALAFFRVDSLKRALSSAPVIKLVYRIIDEDGQISRKKTRAFYLDETREEIVIIRRDITDLYEEEQRQKQILQNAVNEANEANRAKSEFLSRMSHDIRTPLNAVIGMTELARAENNPPRTEEYLSNIDVSSHFLLGLINDILDLSRIESGKLCFHEEPYTCEEFTRNILTVIQPLMRERNIDFELDLSRCADCLLLDKLRFNQIFFNLLSNAAKFTPEGGRVEFTGFPLPERGGLSGYRFFVRDNGIGMSADFLKVLFEPFSQERATSSDVLQGTGLGLAIVKTLVEAMGGGVSVESSLGEGTTFTVDIYAPVAAPIARGALQTAAPSGLAGAHVLLCEDNAMNVIVAQRLLESKGCIVDVALDGRLAVERFAASKEGFYRVILMDVRMPVLNGLDAAKEIRALRRADAGTVPIIAMTADAFAENVEQSRAAGMNAHITKPIDTQILFDTLQKYV